MKATVEQHYFLSLANGNDECNFIWQDEVKREYSWADLSERAYNVLKRLGVKDIDGILQIDLLKLPKCRNCGHKTVAEITRMHQLLQHEETKRAEKAANNNEPILKTIKTFATNNGVTTAYIYKLIKENKMRPVIIDGVQFINITKYPAIPTKVKSGSH